MLRFAFNAMKDKRLSRFLADDENKIFIYQSFIFKVIPGKRVCNLVAERSGRQIKVDVQWNFYVNASKSRFFGLTGFR